MERMRPEAVAGPSNEGAATVLAFSALYHIQLSVLRSPYCMSTQPPLTSLTLMLPARS
jgi:hypothetical protein